MGKPMTKSQLVSHLAKKTGITEKTVDQLLGELSAIALKEAKNTFTLPGIGKLVRVDYKARMGRNPRTGERVRIPAKSVVKFQVNKAAKDAILGVR